MPKPLLLSERCATCIFRPAPDRAVSAARAREVITLNRQAGAMLICHSTLHSGEEVDEAICRGYWDAYRDEANVVRVMDRLSQGEQWWEEVPPPKH